MIASSPFPGCPHRRTPSAAASEHQQTTFQRAPMAMVPPSPAVQALIDAFRSADARVKDLISKQQMFDAQRTENGMVEAELNALKEGEPVYKLTGSTLVLHDAAEAKAAVSQRLKFIAGEL